MRILCWNVQGQLMDSRVGARGAQVGLIDYLERWSVDVAIILEPPADMRTTTPALTGEVITRRDTDNSVNVPTDWRSSTHLDGHPQGHLAVVFNRTAVTATIVRGFRVPNGVQDNHLVYLRLDEVAGGARCVVATCHTPYLQASAANQYNTNAMQGVIQAAHHGVPANYPDFWMGDLNAYSVSMFSGRQAGEYLPLLLGPTSGFGGNGGHHSPLDRIFKRQTCHVSAYGRVTPTDIRQMFGDLQEVAWTSATVPSDHLPIYVDTSPVAAVSATAPPPTGGVKRGGARDPMPPDPPRVKRSRKLPPPGSG